MISYIAEEVKMPIFSRREISKWIKQVVALHQCKVGDVNFIFCSDDKILAINMQYLQHDYYTDIITFDYSEGKKISGDIFISIDTVRTNSLKYKQGYENELFRVLVHGVLHLCGQKDKSSSQREVMTRLENEALSLLLYR